MTTLFFLLIAERRTHILACVANLGGIARRTSATTLAHSRYRLIAWWRRCSTGSKHGASRRSIAGAARAVVAAPPEQLEPPSQYQSQQLNRRRSNIAAAEMSSQHGGAVTISTCGTPTSPAPRHTTSSDATHRNTACSSSNDLTSGCSITGSPP